MTRTKLALIVGGVLVVLIGLRFTLFNAPPPVSSQERLQEIFREGKQAFESEDVDGLMAFVADDFRWEGMDKQRLRLQLVQFFKDVNSPRAHYKEPLQIEIFGGRAVVRTEVSVSWEGNEPNAQRYGPIEIEFRLERGRRWGIFPYEDWKAVKIQGLSWEEVLGQ